MILDQETLVQYGNCILLPYSRAHVKKYHLWMQNEDLQLLTASEPLSLEEEYEMQKAWQFDEDKLTFLIADFKIVKSMYMDSIKCSCSGKEFSKTFALCANLFRFSRKDSFVEDCRWCLTEPKCLIGDINLFIDRNQGEINMMVAEETYRNQGYGSKALESFLFYIKHYLNGIAEVIAKISVSNTASLKFFKKMGFQETSRSEVFEEVTMTLYMCKWDADNEEIFVHCFD